MDILAVLGGKVPPGCIDFSARLDRVGASCGALDDAQGGARGARGAGARGADAQSELLGEDASFGAFVLLLAASSFFLLFLIFLLLFYCFKLFYSKKRSKEKVFDKAVKKATRKLCFSLFLIFEAIS